MLLKTLRIKKEINMPDGTVPLLIALIVLIFLSAFFSSTETAFSCVNKIKLRSTFANGNKRAGKILKLAEEDFDKLISTVLIGNNIVNISSATIATVFFAKIITNGINSEIVSTLVMTVAVLIFGEITPKFIAKTYPEKTASYSYPIILIFYYVFYPLNLLSSGWQWLIAKVFRLKADDIVTEEEIMTVVEEAEEDGTIRKDETRLIRSVIEFDDVEVGDILVPRVNMIAVNENSSMEEIKNVFIKEGFSRLLIYKDSIDTVIGTVHEKDFFKAYINGEKNIKNILQDAFYTTEHIKISKLLKQLQKKRLHIAVVLDEYGGTMGLVTLEDILEELVGEIWDEHDEIISAFKKIDNNKYSVLGNTPLQDFFAFFKLKGEENFNANTLSGWIIESLGEIPKTNTTFSYENIVVEVSQATVKKVLLAKVTVNNIEN